MTSALCLALLSGCVKAKPSVDVPAPGPENTSGQETTTGEEEDPGKAIRDSVLEQLGKNNTSDDDTGDEPVADPGEDEIITRNAPELVLQRAVSFKYGGEDYPDLRHRYGFFCLDKKDAVTYPELDRALKDVASGMITEQKSKWEEDIRLSETMEAWFLIEKSWKSFLRRADEKYISIVTEYCEEGVFDDGFHTRYTGHNIYADTGEEVDIFDVVADEEALLETLAENVYAYLEYAYENFYFMEVQTDLDIVRQDLAEGFADGDIAWSLDPAGITFYFNAMTMLRDGFSQTILFESDYDGTIFYEEFAKAAPDTWVMQIPEYIPSYVDVNESGVPVVVRSFEQYELDEEQSSDKETFYLSGLGFSCGGTVSDFPTVMPGGTDYYDVFLVHKDYKTYLLECHSEYDTSFINMHDLDRHGVMSSRALNGRFELCPDAEISVKLEGSTYDPYYIPTDAERIRIMAGDDLTVFEPGIKEMWEDTWNEKTR